MDKKKKRRIVKVIKDLTKLRDKLDNIHREESYERTPDVDCMSTLNWAAGTIEDAIDLLKTTED